MNTQIVLDNTNFIAQLPFTAPYQTFIYPTGDNAGKPVAGGFLWFGEPSQDPTTEANQRSVFGIDQNGERVFLKQPISLSAGGVPQLAIGSPVILQVDGDCSVLLQDSAGAEVYYTPQSTNLSSNGFSGYLISESITATAGQTEFTFSTVSVTSAAFFYRSESAALFQNVVRGSLIKGLDYTIQPEDNKITMLLGVPAGYTIEARQNDPTGQVLDAGQFDKQVLSFNTIADAKAENLTLGKVVAIGGKNAVGDGGVGDEYIVVAAATGTADDLNYIDLDNGLQLQLLSKYRSLSGYSSTKTDVVTTSNTINIDFAKGDFHTVDLSQNVSAWTFENIAQSGRVSSASVKLVQDAIGGRTVAFPASFKFSGGAAPTITATADAFDRIFIYTDDGGATFECYVSGQDVK